MSDIVDNRNETLVDTIKSILDSTESAWFEELWDEAQGLR